MKGNAAETLSYVVYKTLRRFKTGFKTGKFHSTPISLFTSLQVLVAPLRFSIEL